MPSSKKHRARDPLATLCKSIYVMQRYNWDCGLACAEMAMKWVNVNPQSSHKVDATPMQPLAQGDPLWNIELYVALRERGVNAEMSTSEKGVNKSTTELGFYKDIFSGNVGGDSNDSVVDHTSPNAVEANKAAIINRISSKFSEAEKRGWVVNDAVTTKTFVEMLGDNGNSCCALVLINWYILKSGNVLHPDFFGHCILVVGYDFKKEMVKYLDPLVGPKVQSATTVIFDAARLSEGTDMDLIIVRSTEGAI